MTDLAKRGDRVRVTHVADMPVVQATHPWHELVEDARPSACTEGCVNIVYRTSTGAGPHTLYHVRVEVVERAGEHTGAELPPQSEHAFRWQDDAKTAYRRGLLRAQELAREHLASCEDAYGQGFNEMDHTEFDNAIEREVARLR